MRLYTKPVKQAPVIHIVEFCGGRRNCLCVGQRRVVIRVALHHYFEFINYDSH
jgi:hypothetical protein